MKLVEFAEKYNLKAKKLEGELVILGRKVKRNNGLYPAPNPRYPLDCLLGHIFEYSSTRMGLVFMPRRPKLWTMLRKKMLAAGFEIRQNGDWEGTATFDPADSAQARLAIEVIGARKKRQASEAQLKNLARLRTLITSSNPSIKPPLGPVELLETSRGIDGVGGYSGLCAKTSLIVMFWSNATGTAKGAYSQGGSWVPTIFHARFRLTYKGSPSCIRCWD